MLRLFPFAPFTVVNVVAGASTSGCDFLFGTLFAETPGHPAHRGFRARSRRRDPRAQRGSFRHAVRILIVVIGLVMILKRRFGNPRHEIAGSPIRGRLTIATYNIHGAVGTDGRFSPERIAWR
jgi:uncharacterized membrane protein YdjX (TVP38/TMEM64 family)